jgi:hypothetical protein
MALTSDLRVTGALPRIPGRLVAGAAAIFAGSGGLEHGDRGEVERPGHAGTPARCTSRMDIGSVSGRAIAARTRRSALHRMFTAISADNPGLISCSDEVPAC